MSKRKSRSSSESSDSSSGGSSSVSDYIQRIKELERQFKKFKKSKSSKKDRRHNDSADSEFSCNSVARESRSRSRSRQVNHSRPYYDSEAGSASSIRSEYSFEKQDADVIIVPESNGENRNNEQAGSHNDEQTVENSLDQPEKSSLKEEVLSILGKRIDGERCLAPVIHEDFALHFGDIIKKGLPKEDISKFIQKYPPPENLTCLDPPKLNPEIEVAVQSTVTERDRRIVKKQEKLAAGLSACTRAISLLLAKPDNSVSKENLERLECFTDVSKLLADLQHDETSIRRSLIAANVNSSLKETLTKTSRDEFLFGNKLDEVLKTAKAVEKTSKEFKVPVKTSNTKQSKNLIAPSRQPQVKKYSSTAATGYQRYRDLPQKRRYHTSRQYKQDRKKPSRGRY